MATMVAAPRLGWALVLTVLIPSADHRQLVGAEHLSDDIEGPSPRAPGRPGARRELDAGGSGPHVEVDRASGQVILPA